MNPYKSAINLVLRLYDTWDRPPGPSGPAIHDIVVAELSQIFKDICAEENGLSSAQILNATEFGFENDRRRVCDACPLIATVHMLVTRDNGETKEVYACKGHMLDPGPLLDW